MSLWVNFAATSGHIFIGFSGNPDKTFFWWKFSVTSEIIEIFLTQFRAKFGSTAVKNFLSWSRINLFLNIILENKNQSRTALLVDSRWLCSAWSSNNLYAAVELLLLVWSLAVSQGNYISRIDLAIQLTFYSLTEVKLLFQSTHHKLAHFLKFSDLKAVAFNSWCIHLVLVSYHKSIFSVCLVFYNNGVIIV